MEEKKSHTPNEPTSDSASATTAASNHTADANATNSAAPAPGRSNDQPTDSKPATSEPAKAEAPTQAPESASVPTRPEEATGGAENTAPASATQAGPEAATSTAAAAAVAPSPTETAPRRRSLRQKLFIFVALVLVVIAIGAVWMRLENEGRVGTSVFSGLIESQEAAATVAIVNGEALQGSDLELSLEQLRQAAQSQGMDPQSPEIQTEIRDRAVDMLVNTTLLQQAAEAEGIVITDEQVSDRIAELETEAGGAEALLTRMDEFGIDPDTFAEDIKTEITITALLDQIFAEAELTVTDEEVSAVYEQAGGTAPDAPALEEVRPQIEAQIRQSKEQAVVDEYLDELRSTADIEIVS